MECKRFFELAIDADDRPSAALQKEIDDHREACPACRKVEEDHKFILLALPSKLPPPPPPAFRQRVVDEARKAFAEHRAEQEKASRNGHNGKSTPGGGPLGKFIFLFAFVGLSLGTFVLGTRWKSAPEQAALGNKQPDHELSAPESTGQKPSDPKKEQGTGQDEMVLPPHGDVELGGGHFERSELGVAESLLRSSDEKSVVDALEMFQKFEKSPDLDKRPHDADRVHLGAAQSLVFLKRIPEAKVEAQAVLDSATASPSDKKRAQWIKNMP